MLKIVNKFKVFGGMQYVVSHDSKFNSCSMELSFYIPSSVQLNISECGNFVDGYKEDKKLKGLFYLSGLTCTWENVTSKGGYQQYAWENDMIIVCPNTSPLGDDIPNEDGYDIGQGAGFYVDATTAKWSKNFNMYSYVNVELVEIVSKFLPIDMEKLGIFGHSMGGHGALISAIRNKNIYKSVSAFAPIVSPLNCPWGEKAFTTYLGDNSDNWSEYDACYLLGKYGYEKSILVSQGLGDNFLVEQLKPEILISTCVDNGIDLIYKAQEDYDHSYYFISTFMKEHIEFHANNLK